VAAPSPWASLVSVRALLGHIVLMLGVMAVLTVVNLLVNPGTWWSLAIQVVWFSLVIIHALALVSMGVILEEDEEESAPAPRIYAEPAIPPQALTGWSVPATGTEPAQELPSDPGDPGPWRAAPIAGPDQSEVRPAKPETAEPAADTEPAPTPDFTPLSFDPETGKSERIPWRAVTDIAWLRRRTNGDTGTSDSDRKASS
jgi:hypothetical protein